MGKKISSIDLFDKLKPSNDSHYLSIGCIVELELNKHTTTLEFKNENFIGDTGTVNSHDDNEFQTQVNDYTRNLFVYILDKEKLHVITLNRDNSVNFNVSNLSSKHIIVLAYYNESHNLNTPSLTLTIKKNNNPTNAELENKWTLLNRFVNKVNCIEKLYKWLDHLQNVLYYEISGTQSSTPNGGNYGQRLSSFFNVCLAFDLEFNNYFLDFLNHNLTEIDGTTSNSDDVWMEVEETENDTSNYLFFTQEHITPCVLNTIKHINKSNKQLIRFESSFYYVSGKYTTEDVSRIFKQLLADTDTHLMLFSNFILQVKDLQGLEDALNVLRLNDESFITKMSFELHVSAMGGDVLNTILNKIKEDNQNYLYGVTFRMYKWNREVIKQLAVYNNSNLHHIRFDTGYDVDLLKTIKKYNHDTLKNVYFINSEKDDNIMVLDHNINV